MSGAPSPLITPLSAAGLATVLELGGLTYREALPTAPLGVAVWLLSTFALLFAAALLLDLLRRALRRIPRVPAVAARLADGALGWPLFALGLAAGIAAWTADLVLYVRLYPGWHAALGLSAMAAFVGAMALAVHRQGPPRGHHPAVAFLAVVGAIGVPHAALQLREDAKASLLGHGVIAADLAWLGDRASDVDFDGVGLLFTAADHAPLDEAHAVEPVCLGVAFPPEGALEWRPPPPAAPLDVLLITIDALRRDHAPPDGARFMPATAALAEQSVVFSAAYAPAAMTLPSVAALHTGRFPWALAWAPTVVGDDERVRVVGPGRTWPRAWPGDPRVGTVALDRHPTLAEGLTAAGWRTVGWPPHESFLAPFGLGRGFVDYAADVVARHNPNGVSVTGGVVVDRALAFIEAHRRDHPERPYFAWVHLFDPHHPYRWPPGTDTTVDSDLARYRAEVLYTDLQIARLLSRLAQTGLDRRTVVILTADHGESFGERGAGYHSTGLFDELVRVPLIVRAPGLEPRVVHRPVSLVDVAPTLAGLLDLPRAPTWQGRDLGPLLRGEPLPEDALPADRPSGGPRVLAEVAYEDIHRQYLVREGRWTLVWDWGRGYRQLFDVEADPAQLDNRVVAEPEVAERLTARLCNALKVTDGLAVPAAEPPPPTPLLGASP